MSYRSNWKSCLLFLAVMCMIHFTEALDPQYPNTTIFRRKRQSECNRDQFACKNDQCIARLYLCDGQKTCRDGSDEVFEQCRAIECPDSRFTYRCEYGACITRRLRCDGKNDCIDGSDEVNCDTPDGCYLPEHIQYGSFRMSNRGRYTPNELVPSSTGIQLFCAKNDAKPQDYFYCHKTEWKPSLEGITCPNPNTCTSYGTSTSEEVFCKYDGQPVSCHEPINNTTLIVRCQPFHTYQGQRPIYRCENGKWDQLIPACTPECGTKSVSATTLIIGGNEALKNEYPWVAGVYNSTNHQICGGTIISRSYVLSAAHCFTTTDGKPHSKDNYFIAAGKHSRDLNVVEEFAQTRKIEILYIHGDYRGSHHKYRDDIALLKLETKLKISQQIQPICIDWETSYEDFDFQEGKLGVVAGWGSIKLTGDPSEVLKKLIVPYRTRDNCLKELPVDFGQEFYTSDKICAGYKDENANVCSGDSGSGLFFQSDGRKYYLRGIVSIAVRSKIGCDANTYALYTRVSRYLPWLEEKTRRIV